MDAETAPIGFVSSEGALARAVEEAPPAIDLPGAAPGPRWERRDTVLSLLVTVLAAAAILPTLGAEALSNWDEALYGTLTREFLAKPSWTISYGFEPYFEKPPLGVWLMALASAPFGESELALRLPSALAGIAGVWLTYVAGRKLANSTAGLLSALLVLGVPHFVAWSRVAMLDTPMVFFGLAAFVLVLHGEDRPWLTVAAGAAFGLAVLTKFVEAFLFLPGIVALLLARPASGSDLAWSRRSQALWATGAAAIVAAPWHLQQLWVHGWTFLKQYVIWDVVERLIEPLEDHQGDAFYYLGLYSHNAGALAPVHAAGVLLACALAWRRRDGRLAATALYAGAAFLGVSLMQTKIGWYLEPVYPGAAIATGVAAALLLRGRRVETFAVVGVLALAVAGALDGRGDFLDGYEVLDHSPDVRELATSAFFVMRLPLLYTHVVDEPAPHYYLADRVIEVDDAKLEKLIATGEPFVCLTYPQYADEIVRSHAGLGLVTENDSIAVIGRPPYPFRAGAGTPKRSRT